ncbi:hypothetical protein H0H92_007438 [Tricholoma furcatifolium]|nr:hypothetical protein H0H92_007438 [Tricholoma furcatifolium]
MNRQKSSERTSYDTASLNRRIRHITAIQVHNLTPCPVRDSFASGLTKPSEQSQFSTHGHLSDDLDISLQRKRSRRISATSHRSLRSEDGPKKEGTPMSGSLAERGRRTSGHRVNFSSEGTDAKQHATNSAPTIRPYRARTSSMASSIGSGSALSYSIHSLNGSAFALTPSFGTVFPDNSQAELEKVIQSRLVETFITITVLEPPSLQDVPPTLLSPLKSPSMNSSNAEGTAARKALKQSPLSPSDKTKLKIRRDSAASPRTFTRPSISHTKSASTSFVRTNGESKQTHSQFASSVQNMPPKPDNPTPHYFSPIHKPSTHPQYTIDIGTDDFETSVDTGESKMKVELWAKVSAGWGHRVKGKGKEKEAKELDNDVDWKLLQVQDVDLNDLIPLSDPSALNALPSNSLLITLSPPGSVFYLPSPTSSPKRSPSPADGYTSDPESDVKSAKKTDHSILEADSATRYDHSATPLERRHGAGNVISPLSPHKHTTASTAGWQDLLKLVTLQSCILDNESSLSDVLQGIDQMIVSDVSHVQRREISEREARLEELIVNQKKVIQDSKNLHIHIRARIEDLQKRKEILELAKEHLRQEVESGFDAQNQIATHQAQHAPLRARIGPTRTTLIDILSSIFPIDLLSPPDLLYTILDVPLPIPLASSDPAPPLTMPSHKEVNEDAVATALGYVAQVVQLLAAYLGKHLVYPVTCIGSRSLIRDNISAMVGPRMFPLYSKGVDTYRFEYGVFLLNKNIELLMTDKDLRALDMRHTLPNLKNLLLTLTNGERAQLQQSRPPDSPLSLSSELDLNSRPESPVDTNTTTPKPSDRTTLDGNTTPPASVSGSSTPTSGAAAGEASKKSRSSFLAFSPFSGFLRGRQPSSSRASLKSNSEAAQTEETSATTVDSDNSSDDSDDRKTISGASRGVDEGLKVGSSPVLNGGAEKLDDEPHSIASPATPPVVKLGP